MGVAGGLAVGGAVAPAAVSVRAVTNRLEVEGDSDRGEADPLAVPAAVSDRAVPVAVSDRVVLAAVFVEIVDAEKGARRVWDSAAVHPEWAETEEALHPGDDPEGDPGEARPKNALPGWKVSFGVSMPTETARSSQTKSRKSVGVWPGSWPSGQAST